MVALQYPQKRIVDGLLLLDKPMGMTSNAALQTVKRLFKANKAGHTGSLDPLATGMLPIVFGKATKLGQFLLETDKTYHVVAKLGLKTTTGDAEGKFLGEFVQPAFTSLELATVLAQFRGDILQVPPMSSALKHQGEPLYKLARQGITIPRKPRPVCIHELILLSQSKDELVLQVRCSKGTYIRTLVEDIGDALKCGAYVSGLRRLSVGHYEATAMFTLEALTKHDPLALDSLLLPPSAAVASLPYVCLSADSARLLCMGQSVSVPDTLVSGWVRLLLADGEFLGIGEMVEGGKVAPRRLVKYVN